MLCRVLVALLLLIPTSAYSAAILAPWNNGPRVPFSLPRLGGGQSGLARYGGSVVLVHFFATWCEPCRSEMASLQRLADHYGGRPLMIVAINVAEVAPRVERFFEAQPVPFPVLFDSDRAVSRAWKIDTLPTTIVLDATSAPVLLAEGDVDWNRADIRRTLEAHLPAEPVPINQTSPAIGGTP
jgi:thiol-disulfide isomerase/thioredoxin